MPTGERTLVVGQINMDHPAAYRRVNGKLGVNPGYLHAALSAVIHHLPQLRDDTDEVGLRDEAGDCGVVTFKWWEGGDTPREPPKLKRIK